MTEDNNEDVFDAFAENTNELPKQDVVEPQKKEEPTLNERELQMVADKATLLAKEELSKKHAAKDAREWYRKNGGRRWVCRVNANQQEVTTFETVVENPSTGLPEPILVKCGVIIKDGLPLAAIKECKARSFSFTEDVTPNIMAMHGLTHKLVTRPMYSVEVFNEVKDPKPIGRAGKVMPTISNEQAFG